MLHNKTSNKIYVLRGTSGCEQGIYWRRESGKGKLEGIRGSTQAALKESIPGHA